MDGPGRLALFIFSAIFIFSVPAEPVPLWRQAAGGTIISRISAQLQSVVAVIEGGSIKAIGASGTLLWDYKVNGRFLPYLTRSRSAASYVCRTNGEFFALNRVGQVQWRLGLNEPITYPPLSGWDERVFIFLERRVLCFTASGQRLWQKSLAVPITSEPVIDAGGGCIFMLQDNTFVCLSPYGEQNEIKLPAPPAALVPVTVRQTRERPGGRTLVIYNDGRLELYDMHFRPQGNLVHLGAAPLAAASWRNYVAVQLATGELILLDVERGQIRWRVPSQPGVGGAGNLAQKTRIQFDGPRRAIYVLSISGAMCFTSEGDQSWNMRLEDAAVAPAFDGGILYSGGRDWILNAWDTEYRSKKETPALIPPPAGLYGLGSPPQGREWDRIRYNLHLDYSEPLKELGNKIKRGRIGEDELEGARLLLGILSDNRTLTTDRIEAARLLGSIGSQEAIQFLSRCLVNETEAAVQAEIALALGQIGSDPQGRALNAFERLIERNQLSTNDALLTALAGALGTMSRFSGPPVSERAAGLLVQLSSVSSSAARQQAREELDKLVH
ncbi:MAG: PQQ-binding-like beta-propeller repeat protein [Spirochaetaceae bacterium]|nr:PQQ-binding-like beta-propeller repeat protein [Spirochaetaceae bacterium]